MNHKHPQWNRALRIALALTCTLAASTLPAQEAETDFSDGAGDQRPDQYPGARGAGWAEGWQIPKYAKNIDLNVELDPGDPSPHLVFTMQVQPPSQDYNNASVMRKYRDADRPHQIRMKIQMNHTEGFNDYSDFVGAFGGENPRTNFTSTSTWAVRTVGKTPDKWKWGAYHGEADGGDFSGRAMQEIGGRGNGMLIEPGKIYEITIKNYPEKGSYDITVSNGKDEVSSAGLRYRAQKDDWAPEESGIAFQAQTNESDASVSFSIFEVEISPLN